MSSAAKNLHLGHFLLLDMGYPMTLDSVEKILTSLINILALASCIKGRARIPVFGFGTLEKHLTIIQEWKFLKGNLWKIVKEVECLKKCFKLGTKISLQDYKTLLEMSTRKIVKEFEINAYDWKKNTKTKDKFDLHYYWPAQFQITLITKKAAYPILKMFMDNIELSQNEKLKKIEILEILNHQSPITKISRKGTNFISCSSALEMPQNLDNWILESETEREHLRIILNKGSNLQIKCDLNECVVNPNNLPLPQDLSLSTSVTIYQKSSCLKNNRNSICELEIISKIGITKMCPSFLFGFPHRAYATRSRLLNWKETQSNEQLFKALCLQLFQTEHGLLTEMKSKFNSYEISALYFVFSDGRKLLISNVIPIELHLPERPEFPTTSQIHTDMKEAMNIVRTLLDEFEVSENYSPHNFSTRIYEALKEHLISEEKKSILNFFDYESEKIPRRKNCRGIKNKTKNADPYSSVNNEFKPGEYIPKFLRNADYIIKETADEIPKRMVISDATSKRDEYSIKRVTDEEKIHPALLSPKTVAKYRKTDSYSFKLSELIEPSIVEE